MTKRMRMMGMVPALAVLVACGGESAAVADQPAEPVVGAPVVGEPVAEAAPAAGGEVIEVRMTMVDGGSFDPARVEASRGDVIRFVNVDNVHNVSFPAAQNAAAANLPAPSQYLTTPGQAHELTVDLAPGTYSFQCDPHMAMGMKGTLIVR